MKMRSFSDELYHYGVKGMRWGVITKKDEPKNPKGRAKGGASKTPTDDGGTAYLNAKRAKGETYGKKGSYTYNEEKSRQTKEKLKKVPINQYSNGVRTNFLDSNGLPRNKDDAHAAAMVMASQYMKENYSQLPASIYDPMMLKFTEQFKEEILDAMEWENKGKKKALKKFAEKGRDKTNDLLPKLKRTLKEVGEKISSGIKKAKAKIKKALNIKDSPMRRTPLGKKDWEKIIKSNKK